MNEAANFEKSMQRLEEITKELESGKLPLEKSIALYREGMKLSEDCRAALNSAELIVKTIDSEGDEA
jgi:exodeoxyribonuclease VII small subunit